MIEQTLLTFAKDVSPSCEKFFGERLVLADIRRDGFCFGSPFLITITTVLR